VILRGGLRRAAQQPAARIGIKRAIADDHGHGARTAGQRRQRFREHLHAARAKHRFDHRVVDLAGGLAGDDNPGSDLTQLDAIGDVHDAVEDAQAGIADVVDRFRADTQLGGDTAGGGRLEFLAADGGVDQHLDIFRTDVRHCQRLAGGLHSAA